MGTIATVVTYFMQNMTGVVEIMTTEGNEILLIPIGIFAVGATIGLAKRLIGA